MTNEAGSGNGGILVNHGRVEAAMRAMREMKAVSVEAGT